MNFPEELVSNLTSLTLFIDPESMQPFVIGYFKEEIYEEDPVQVETTKNAQSNVYINPKELFTKDFLSMKTKNITAPSKLHKRDLWINQGAWKESFFYLVIYILIMLFKK